MSWIEENKKKMFSQYICLVLLISSLAQIYAATIDDDFKVINIESGKIRGKLLPSFLDQRKFYSFRGIPYAKPPLGELRFKVHFFLSHFLIHTYVREISNKICYSHR